MKTFSFYVIFRGRQTGIFTDWYSEVEPAINGFSGEKQFGFDDLDAAQKAWNMGLEAYEAMRFRDTSDDDIDFRMDW